jgi:hypothetical protein
MLGVEAELNIGCMTCCSTRRRSKWEGGRQTPREAAAQAATDRKLHARTCLKWSGAELSPDWHRRYVHATASVAQACRELATWRGRQFSTLMVLVGKSPIIPMVVVRIRARPRRLGRLR